MGDRKSTSIRRKVRRVSEPHFPRQATLIVNPFASRVTEDRIRAVEAGLRPAETLLTERRGHATELAAGAGGDAVWVLGGDGLVNEVLNGLRPGIQLGVVPGGHTNVFARALGLGLHGREERLVSLGRVNGRRFTFAAGIGVDAETVRALETGKRKQAGRRAGDAAYVREVGRRLLSGYEPRLQLPGFGRASILLVSNGPVFTYLGRIPLRFSPQATWEGGLDLVAPERVRAWSVPRLLGRVALGRGLSDGHAVLSGHDLDRIEAICDSPTPLQADGEDLGDVTEVVFEAERGAVAVLV